MKEYRKITVGYLTSQDPKNKKSWSGIHYFISRELEQRFSEIIYFGPVKVNPVLRETLNTINKFHRLFYGKKFNRQHNNILSRFYARQFRAKLRNNRNIDVLIAPAASTEIAFLKSKVPIIYISDTSYSQIKDYYDSYSNFSSVSNKIADKIEQRSISNSSTLIYSSNWAAEHVKSNYIVDNKIVRVIPFGANIEIVPSREKINKNYTGVLNLLFLGKQWERKGGPLVLETVKLLHQAGYKVHLTICGCTPPIAIKEDFITVYNFLNKNNRNEYNKFLDLMYESHLLFLPTLADCTPIVFCEAAAFGLPVLSRDTGGVNSIVRNEVSGILLSEGAQVEDYYQTLIGFIEDPQKLIEMSQNARNLYETNFNWNNWGNRIEKVIMEAMRYNKIENEKGEI